jgi:hypothetical protein
MSYPITLHWHGAWPCDAMHDNESRERIMDHTCAPDEWLAIREEYRETHK